MHKGIVLVFVLLVITYLVVNTKRISKLDTSLLTVSVVALTWKYLTSKNIIETNKEHYLDSTETLLDTLDNLKPIVDEEVIKPISNNLIMYFTSFNSLSYTPNTKEWRNVIDTTQAKNGALKCNTSMYFDLMPSFSKVSGFTLGSNKITGPYSNTLGINYRGQYTLALAFKHGNLQNDTTQYDKIELIKLWANSPNNNGISLYVEPGSLQFLNNTQSGKLMFQYADYSPVHCKISKEDDLIPIESNILCFVFIVKADDKVRVLYMTERNTNLITLAEFNVATTDVTFSNKEMSINRFGNWNSNIFNFAVYKSALSDVAITNVYTHIKNHYVKTNDPSYKPVVDKYNETIDKLQRYINCPFDEKTCKACESVKEWNDFSNILNAPRQCKKAISAYCKKNTGDTFCKCWDKDSDSFNTNACKTMKSLFEDDASITLSRSEYDKLKGKCSKTSGNEGALQFDNSYTFDKVRVKYDEGLTTKERIALGQDVELPDIMTTNDYQKNMANSRANVLLAPQNKTKTSTDDNQFWKAVMNGSNGDDDNVEETNGGLWSFSKWFS